MSKLTKVSIAIVLVVLFGSKTVPAQSQTPIETSVTVGGAGTYPTAAVLYGLPVHSFTVGGGLKIFSDGAASGGFEVQLQTTGLLGLPQTISVESDVLSGSFDALGNPTFKGLSQVDLGDGSLPLIRIPVVAMLAKLPDGTWNFALTVANVALPATGVADGSITVEAVQ
jgi:hypothetical protein